MFVLLGFHGIKVPETTCSWCRPINLWLRIGAGRGYAIDGNDRNATGGSDFIMTTALMYEIPLRDSFWLATMLGTLLFEDVLRYRTDSRGRSLVESDAGWHQMRLMAGFQIKATL